MNEMLTLLRKVYHRLQRILYFYKQFFTRRITFINNSFSKQLALTFDDGPDPVLTGKILDFLSENNIYATFFLSGPAIEKVPDMASRIVHEGHCIGNHGFEHVLPDKLMQDVLIKGFEKTDQLIKNISGVSNVRFYRPPYGKETKAFRSWICKKSAWSVRWSLDSYDYRKDFTTDQRSEKLLHDIQNGEILLFHDTKSETFELLKLVVPVLQERKYQFMRLDERFS